MTAEQIADRYAKRKLGCNGYAKHIGIALDGRDCFVVFRVDKLSHTTTDSHHILVPGVPISVHQRGRSEHGCDPWGRAGAS